MALRTVFFLSLSLNLFKINGIIIFIVFCRKMHYNKRGLYRQLSVLWTQKEKEPLRFICSFFFKSLFQFWVFFLFKMDHFYWFASILICMNLNPECMPPSNHVTIKRTCIISFINHFGKCFFFLLCSLF